jgi:hypothetical protein
MLCFDIIITKKAMKRRVIRGAIYRETRELRRGEMQNLTKMVLEQHTEELILRL